MGQTIAALIIVALAAAWSLRGFWPRLRALAGAKPAAKAKGGCENCDCGH